MKRVVSMDTDPVGVIAAVVKATGVGATGSATTKEVDGDHSANKQNTGRNGYRGDTVCGAGSDKGISNQYC